MDTIQNFEYLFAAYAILWVVVFGYFFYITRQLGDLRREVNALREQHTSRESGAGEASDS